MIPTTRQSFADYCLRALGYPVIQINIDDDQLDDRIDEALQFYREYHSDAIFRAFFQHELTEDDVDNRYIPIQDEILNVTRILPFSFENSTLNMFNVRYQMALSDMFNLGFAGNLSNYSQTMSYISTLDMILNGLPQVEFNRHMNRLYIFDNLREGRIQAGNFVIIEGYRIVDPNQAPDIWNDTYLKRYAIALIKKQWGINLKKFSGVEMLGGVTLNGQEIYQEAIEEIQRLEEEVRLNWEQPIDFYVG